MVDLSGMYSSAIRGRHGEGSADGTTFQDFLQLTCRSQLVPWPEIQAVATERALDSKAGRKATLEFSKPQQVCTEKYCATLSSVQPVAGSAVGPGSGLEKPTTQ
eukprot:365383-Chlamydomonas_euryale.AAC.12